MTGLSLKCLFRRIASQLESAIPARERKRLSSIPWFEYQLTSKHRSGRGADDNWRLGPAAREEDKATSAQLWASTVQSLGQAP